MSDAEAFTALHPHDVGITAEEVHRMALLFGRHLPVALKPPLLRYLLDSDNGPVVYLDPQVRVYGSLDPLIEGAAPGTVVLVPHELDPLPRDGLDPDETAILGQGVFSAGVLALGPATHDFIEFLKVRLRRECRIDIAHMRMLDQRWLDFVPSLYPYRVERDPGVDVAYWNLHERPLTRPADITLARGSPLRTFNFSGYDPQRPSTLGDSERRGSPRVKAADHPLLRELCEEYGEEVGASGSAAEGGEAFGYEFLPGGLPIEDSLRALYSDALESAEESGGTLPPDPFESAGVPEFLGWARESYARQGLAVPDSLDGRPPIDPGALNRASLRSRVGRYVRRRVPKA